MRGEAEASHKRWQKRQQTEPETEKHTHWLGECGQDHVRVLCIAVCALEVPMTVQLSETAEPKFLDVPKKLAGTGRMLAAVKKLCKGRVAYLAGKCRLGADRMVWVVTVLIGTEATGWPGHARSYSQKQLADTPVYPAVTLLLAKVASMQSGYTSREDLAILLGQLDEHGQLQGTVGKFAASRLSPKKIAQEKKSMTRRDILLQSRKTESWIESVLTEAAGHLSGQAGKGELAGFLLEWAGQVTVTDLADVPDDLLSQIPTFEDPTLASLAFNDKFCPQRTERVKVPINDQSNEGRPADYSELLTPTANAERLEAELELKQYLQLMHDGEADEHQLIAARPRPRLFGQEAVMPRYRGCIWDMRSKPFKPLDLVTTLDTHLNLVYWNKHMQGNVDQQLIQFMNDGVATGSLPDLQCCLNPPLISLAEGIKHVVSECDRTVEAGYLEASWQLPFWPSRGGATGTRPKKATFRRITDVETPRHPAVDSEGVMVRGGNSGTKATLTLPKERKGMQEDVMNDEAILRYIGDQLGWTTSRTSSISYGCTPLKYGKECLGC